MSDFGSFDLQLSSSRHPSLNGDCECCCLLSALGELFVSTFCHGSLPGSIITVQNFRVHCLGFVLVFVCVFLGHQSTLATPISQFSFVQRNRSVFSIFVQEYSPSSSCCILPTWCLSTSTLRLIPLPFPLSDAGTSFPIMNRYPLH